MGPRRTARGEILGPAGSQSPARKPIRTNTGGGAGQVQINGTLSPASSIPMSTFSGPMLIGNTHFQHTSVKGLGKRP